MSLLPVPSRLRPHVVWFGEMPLGMDEIYSALAMADVFIAIGTSGHVYPAAGFVHEARLHGAHTVELNLEPSRWEANLKRSTMGWQARSYPSSSTSCSKVCNSESMKRHPFSGCLLINSSAEITINDVY